MITEEEIKYEEMIENRERHEHRDVLLAIRSMINSKPGLDFFKYLFKSLEVTCTPEMGIEGNALFEYLGFLRAGNSIYKLMCEVDPKITATILANIEKEKCDDRDQRYRIEQNSNTSTSE